MDRINLNVPRDVRARLKHLAKLLGVSEAEFARRLVVDGLRAQERQEFANRIAEATTPEFDERTVKIVEAFETMEAADVEAG